MLKSLACSLSALALTLPALGESILVELFASQNCAACPRAHATMAQVDGARDDVLVLTWSVDYWDYLGQPDPMAMEISTQRQEAYVERFGLRGPYTPQTVYAGRSQCPGNRPADVARQLASAQALPDSGAIIRQTEFGWNVHVPAGQAGDIHLVEFRTDAASSAGMVHPVTSMETLGHLSHGGAMAVKTQCASGCALIVQAPGHGEVLAVHRVN